MQRLLSSDWIGGDGTLSSQRPEKLQGGAGRMASDQDLNSGSVGRALVRVSAPMTLGILGVLSVGLADAFFLAR